MEDQYECKPTTEKYTHKFKCKLIVLAVLSTFMLGLLLGIRLSKQDPANTPATADIDIIREGTPEEMQHFMHGLSYQGVYEALYAEQLDGENKWRIVARKERY